MNKQIKNLLAISVACATLPAAAQQYQPEWKSLQNYQAPEWYEDAKLGFWSIYGIYTIPAFMGDHAAEWYGRRMYQKNGQSEKNKGFAQHQHHLENYGDPAKFGYKDFIPMFKAEKFNADEWADLTVRGGAKFFTMMGIFHDNFALWDSKLTKWNSVNMGPKRDLVGEMAMAVRANGLKFGVSNHSGWNFQFYQWNHINGYDAKVPDTKDLYGAPNITTNMSKVQYKSGDGKFEWRKYGRNPVRPSEYDLKMWLAKSKELADLYQPDLYYFDWGFREPEFEPNRRAFAAHYYNQAINWGKGSFGDPQVVINYKNNHFAEGSAVRDYERGLHLEIADQVWQTDDSVYAGHNWSYVPNTPIKSANHIIDKLMDIISKRGVLMLAFGPKADGTFPEDQKQVIYQLGDWLKICGEAVYATRPYEIFGEVGKHWYDKDKEGHKLFIATKEDVRYTRNKANDTLYITMLKWNDKIILKSLKGLDLSNLQSATLLGTNKKLQLKMTTKGLEIALPIKPKYDNAYPIKLKFNGKLPSPIKDKI